jgi:hypothetical protein
MRTSEEVTAELAITRKSNLTIRNLEKIVLAVAILVLNVVAFEGTRVALLTPVGTEIVISDLPREVNLSLHWANWTSEAWTRVREGRWDLDLPRIDREGRDLRGMDG